ncbi:MAG: aspartate-semialdehyde dehydrogenase [Candidatus Melainabacteria bacterium RIFCSPLOWO2_02_FULL_35_15]|nr:MAG: aspartate-semialdehyde dehydrogenase [Candidatus Melainabacteria bacterium RIFCSPLOWO2_12_FULL_35_11]OGI13293.1 MAG: aspartate-semialdehyde dehydrogenase [Candidatus Melainabacteria bacterium RIFCSPLOWO2_02_FULL_35_15]
MSDLKINLAILGATGNVGRMFLQILEERGFPFESLKLLASRKSAGSKIKFKGKEYLVECATKDSFNGINLVLASSGGVISKELVSHAIKAGAVVIDNSSAYRMDPDVPLVIAGVNNADLKKHKGIIANPNCTTAQLMPPLKALHNLAGLKRVIVSTYQSVSGAGKAAMDELTEQTKESLLGRDVASNVPNKKFAFNVIPHIDVFSDDGYTKEEIKVINESRKILNLPDLKITCTAARVPVYIGHSESVNVEFEKSVTRDEIITALKNFGDIEVVDNPNDSLYPMPIDIAGKDPVYVGRIREDKSNPNTFNMWVVADNLRIGAALNAIRIAEVLLKENLVNRANKC